MKLAKPFSKNEDVIKERYRQLSDHFEDFLDLSVCTEYAADVANILRWLW